MCASTLNDVDCAIVGAGVAGLTAALYLARFRRNVLVIDGGQSRASWIPEIHNYPGLVGLSGQQFLQNLRHQAVRYGADVQPGKVRQIGRSGNGFVVETGSGSIHAANILVASGMEDALPNIVNPEDAVRGARLCLCPICDGYEAIDREIACLINPDTVDHALFLRTYTARLTALVSTKNGSGLTDCQMRVLQEASIELVDVDFKIRIHADHALIQLENGQTRIFDALYCLIGSVPGNEFLRQVSPEMDGSGKIITDAHQQTSISGLYAAGDVTAGLCQIAVATGEGAIAASHIHAQLARIPAECQPDRHYK